MLGCFYGNLTRLMGEARLMPRELSIAIGREPEFVTNLIQRRVSPDLDTLHALAEVFKTDAADLLRPEPSLNLARRSRKDWAEKLAKQVLSSALADEPRELVNAPTLDAMLHWWYAGGGLLSALGNLTEHVQIYGRPDLIRMRPTPVRLGVNSMSARELGISTIIELVDVFERSDPNVLSQMAAAHSEVLDGKPNVSLHSILIDMSRGQIVKLSYAWMLLPVHDGEDGRYVMSYSRPFHRNEITSENAEGFPQADRSRPHFVSLD